MSVCIVSAQTGRPITEQLGCGASAAPSGRLISGDGSRPALIIIGRRRWRPLRATAADPTPPTARGPGWPPLDTRRNNARFMEARRGPQLNKTLYIGGGITARARGAGCEAAAARERRVVAGVLAGNDEKFQRSNGGIVLLMAVRDLAQSDATLGLTGNI